MIARPIEFCNSRTFLRPSVFRPRIHKMEMRRNFPRSNSIDILAFILGKSGLFAEICNEVKRYSERYDILVKEQP